jgi:hypothetical protein
MSSLLSLLVGFLMLSNAAFAQDRTLIGVTKFNQNSCVEEIMRTSENTIVSIEEDGTPGLVLCEAYNNLMPLTLSFVLNAKGKLEIIEGLLIGVSGDFDTIAETGNYINQVSAVRSDDGRLLLITTLVSGDLRTVKKIEQEILDADGRLGLKKEITFFINNDHKVWLQAPAKAAKPNTTDSLSSSN